MRQLDTENGDRDLTSSVTVLTDTPDASNPCLCQGLILLGDGAKDLDGTGGDFEITVTIGSQTLEPDPQTITFSTATRATIFTTAFPVPANTAVVLKVKSPNAADTDVDVTAYLYDVGPLQSTTAGRTLDVNAAGEAGLDFDNTSGTIDAAQLGADCITADKIADNAIGDDQWNVTRVTANADQISGSATAADNAEIVYATDFASNYDAANDRWMVDAVALDGTASLSYLASRTLASASYATAAKLKAYIQLLARSDYGVGQDLSTELDEINADTGSGAGDYSQATDSQEAIRDRGDQAWQTGAGSGATASYTEDTNWTRTVGDNDGGTAADTTTVNGATFDTGETAAGNYLEVDVTVDITAGEYGTSLDVWGFYNGGGSHYIRVQAYNYTDSVYEDLGVIGLRTSVTRYEYNFTPDHTDATNGEIKIKFLHAGGSGVASHVLSIDKMQVNTIAPVVNDGSGLTAVPWNANWDAEVESEVADALNAAIPGSPTAGSINQRIKAIDELTESGGDGDLAAVLTDTSTTLPDQITKSTGGSRTWYVATGGNDSNAGTSWYKPFLTIGQAITDAASGDVIRIGPGSFSEQLDLDTANKSLTFIGSGTYATTVTHSTAAEPTVVLEDGCAFEDMTVEHSAANPGSTESHAFSATNKDGLTLRRCRVIAGGMAISGVTLDNIRLVDCQLRGDETVVYVGASSEDKSLLLAHRCSFSSVDWSDCDAVGVLLSGGRSVIDSCTIYSSTSDFTARYVAGLVVYETSVVSVANTSIESHNQNAGPNAHAYGVYTVSAASRVLLQNCDIKAASDNAGDVYDINMANGAVGVSNCSYSTSNVTAGTLIDQQGDILADTDELQTDWADDGRLDDLLDTAAGEAASVNLTVTPLTSTVDTGVVSDSNLTIYQYGAVKSGNGGAITWTIVDSDGNAVDLSGKAIQFRVFNVGVPGTILWHYDTVDGAVTIGGGSNNIISLSADDTNTGTAGVFSYEMWNTTDDVMIAHGALTIEEATDVAS